MDRNYNKYFNLIELPDNEYIIRLNNRRAGSKKQDLCALGGILMAWQLGIDKFIIQMRKKE